MKYLKSFALCVDSLSYFSFLKFLVNADLVITDSDGIQQETSVLDIPCLSIRDSVDAPYTVEHGTNELVEINETGIYLKADNILKGRRKYTNFPDFIKRLNDGNASVRIASILKGRIK